MKRELFHRVVARARCVHTQTHILVSIGDLQHLHEDLRHPEMLSSPVAVVACSIVNSLCNTLLKADAGALNRELFSSRSVGCAVTLTGWGMYISSTRCFWLCSHPLVHPAKLHASALLWAQPPLSSLCAIHPDPQS